PRVCENAKTLNRDRTSYSFETVLAAHIASPFNFEIELENIILVALRVFEFSHSLGQELTSQPVVILYTQSEMVPIASGRLPTWQCAWACSCAVKTRAVIDRALDNRLI